MKIKCDYCSNTYEDTLPKCPDCGAPNPTQKSVSDADPKTIAQLQAWYQARNLPPSDVTRFYIGVDYKHPKAFGIYKAEDGDFVVYKNKADGSRAVRYKGKDEAYAVNELLQRLKQEIVHQKNMPKKSTVGQKIVGNVQLVGAFITVIAVFLIFVNIVDIFRAVTYRFGDGRHNGYYAYDNETYYHIDDSWYIYDPVIYDWIYLDDDCYDKYIQDVRTIETNYDDYYLSRNWNSSVGTTDWNDSEYYDDHQSSYSSSWDSDSDYDWDSGGSWDSGGTDWDSDW